MIEISNRLPYIYIYIYIYIIYIYIYIYIMNIKSLQKTYFLNQEMGQILTSRTR